MTVDGVPVYRQGVARKAGLELRSEECDEGIWGEMYQVIILHFVGYHLLSNVKKHTHTPLSLESSFGRARILENPGKMTSEEGSSRAYLRGLQSTLQTI